MPSWYHPTPIIGNVLLLVTTAAETALRIALVMSNCCGNQKPHGSSAHCRNCGIDRTVVDIIATASGKFENSFEVSLPMVQRFVLEAADVWLTLLVNTCPVIMSLIT